MYNDLFSSLQFPSSRSLNGHALNFRLVSGIQKLQEAFHSRFSSKLHFQILETLKLNLYRVFRMKQDNKM